MDSRVQRTRRTVLTTGLGGLGGLIASALGRPVTVAAAGNDPVTLGGDNAATAVTVINNSTPGHYAIRGNAAGAGVGLVGTSPLGVGSYGLSTDTAPSTFQAVSTKTGVYGLAGSATNVSTNTDETGVYGFADVSALSTGVWGDSVNGFGVYGTGFIGTAGSGRIGLHAQALTGETGIYGYAGPGDPPVPPANVALQATAESASYIALSVTGRVKLSRSGRVAIAAGRSSAVVIVAGMTASNLVFAVVQTNRSGIYVRAAVPTSGRFTIYLSKAPTARTYVAWTVLG